MDGDREAIETLKMYLDSCNEGTIQNIGAHFMPLFDTVYSFKKFKKPRVLELGRGEHGGSLFALALACKLLKGEIISVDIVEPSENIIKMIADLELQDQIELLTIDDRNIDLRKKLHKASRGFDVIFVDTSHEYIHTNRELKLFYPFLTEGGFFIFHDCPNNAYRVEEALDKFVEKHPELVVVSKRNYSSGLTILKKTK